MRSFQWLSRELRACARARCALSHASLFLRIASGTTEMSSISRVLDPETVRQGGFCASSTTGLAAQLGHSGHHLGVLGVERGELLGAAQRAAAGARRAV